MFAGKWPESGREPIAQLLDGADAVHGRSGYDGDDSSSSEPDDDAQHGLAANGDEPEEQQLFFAVKRAYRSQRGRRKCSADDDDDGDGDGSFPKARHIFGLMGFFGFAVVYAMRVNLSVAIVAMVNRTAIPQPSRSGSQLLGDYDDDTCPWPAGLNATAELPDGEFVWDEETQGLVLGSFFYGYVLTQIPGGRLAERVGGKLIYGCGVLITAIFTLLTPLAAQWNLQLLLLVRALEGMGEGVTYPAMHVMLAHWIPPLERNKFAAIVYAGSNIGTVVSLPLAGWLSSLSVFGGWPSAFYIFGILGIVWFVFWMLLVYDKPSLHPRISRSEREYIKRSMGQNYLALAVDVDLDAEADDESFELKSAVEHDEKRQQRPALTSAVPWRSLFTSLPLWAILITQCGQSWAFYTQLTELPTYMSNILHFDIESNALLNAIPYLTTWVVGFACSWLADHLIKRRYISTLNSLKLWNSVASVVPSLGLIGIIYIGCDWVWVTFMLAGVGSFAGAIYAGNQMNHILLSPRFAGTLYGITNSAANLCGFLAPYAIGKIINNNETLTRWRIVLWLAALLNIVGNFFYLIFASADEQSWSIDAGRPRLRS